MVMQRSRSQYALWAVLTLAAGLATRPLRQVMDKAWAENLGDALWAMLVYWLLAWLWPRQAERRIAVGALLISYAVEVSQLFHPEWLEAIRRTTLGGLVLGWGFAWGDLVAYAVGVAVCYLLEIFLRTKRAGPAGV